MKFCEKIKKIRIDNSLTQEEMASKLFVSRSLIAKWEQDRGIPSIDMLNTIATTFGLTVNDLITDEEIKLITLKNHQEAETNKKNLKIGLIIGGVSVLVLLFTIIFIIVKINSNNDVKSWFKNFETIGEIIDLNDDVIIIADKERQYEINWNRLETKIDRYGNKITYDFLKIGYLVEISGLYNLTHKEYDFKELTVIEEYLEDYEIYGIVITLDDIIPTSIPLWGTDYDDNSWHDRPNDDMYPAYIFALGESKGENWIAHSYFDDKINHLEYNDLTVGFEVELSIFVSLDKKVNVFVIDNSEKGFSFYQSVDATNAYTKRTQIDLSGYVINDILKYSENAFYKYSNRANYKINICHSYSPEKYTIYEYDANNHLINEITFSTLEEFYNKLKGTQEETVYCIIKRFGDKTSTKKVYLGEQYSFELVDEFGYIYSFNHIIE